MQQNEQSRRRLAGRGALVNVADPGCEGPLLLASSRAQRVEAMRRRAGLQGRACGGVGGGSLEWVGWVLL